MTLATKLTPRVRLVLLVTGLTTGLAMIVFAGAVARHRYVDRLTGSVILDSLRASVDDEIHMGAYIERCRVGELRILRQSPSHGGVSLELDGEIEFGPYWKHVEIGLELGPDGHLRSFQQVSRTFTDGSGDSDATTTIYT